MKDEDVFAAIFLLKFYQPEKRERNFDLDMEENCQVTLAFYKFLKKRCSAEEFMNILNEANSDLHEDVMDELKLLHLDVMHINDLFQIDFGDKPDEWIYSIGLDNDHADAIFPMKLQRAFVEFENLEIGRRLQLGQSTKNWIENHFPHLVPESGQEELEESTLEEESDLEMSGDFRLPMPVTKAREETVRFAKKMSKEKVDGFAEMLAILENYMKSGPSVAVEFLAHLLTCNKTSIWDVFNDHFHKISLLATSEQEGRGTKPLRVLALRLGIVLNFFGYTDAATKCLLAAQVHSYTNNDQVVLKQVLLWRSFITDEVLPSPLVGQSDRWSRRAQYGVNLCNQLSKLSSLQRLLRAGATWELTRRILYDWIPNKDQRAAHFLAITHFLVFKSVMYEFYGFRRLSTLTSEMILNIKVPKGQEVSTLLDYSLLKANAAKTLRINLPKSSDTIKNDPEILEDLRRLSEGHFNGIMVCRSSGVIMSLESLEVLIDEWKQNEAQELFEDLLARVNTRESSLFLRIRLQILGAKIRLLGEDEDFMLDPGIHRTLKNAMNHAMQKNYKGLEMEAAVALAQIALVAGQFDHAMSYLKDSEEYYSLNADLFNERSHFLYLLAVNMIRTFQNPEAYPDDTMEWIKKELLELGDEFEGQKDARDFKKFAESHSLASIAGVLLKYRKRVCAAQKTPSQTLLSAVESLMVTN